MIPIYSMLYLLKVDPRVWAAKGLGFRVISLKLGVGVYHATIMKRFVISYETRMLGVVQDSTLLILGVVTLARKKVNTAPYLDWDIGP